MTRPELTERQQQIMMLIGKKKPDECDAVETHIRKKAAELSFQIEQANGAVNSLREQAEAAGKNLNILIGKFLAIAELAEDQAVEKMKSAPKCSGCGAIFPGDPEMLSGSDEILCASCAEKKNAEDGGDAGQQDQAPEEEHPQEGAEQPEGGAEAQQS